MQWRKETLSRVFWGLFVGIAVFMVIAGTHDFRVTLAYGDETFPAIAILAPRMVFAALAGFGVYRVQETLTKFHMAVSLSVFLFLAFVWHGAELLLHFEELKELASQAEQTRSFSLPYPVLLFLLSLAAVDLICKGADRIRFVLVDLGIFLVVSLLSFGVQMAVWQGQVQEWSTGLQIGGYLFAAAALAEKKKCWSSRPWKKRTAR